MRRASLSIAMNAYAVACASFADEYLDASHELCAKELSNYCGVPQRTVSGYGSDRGGGRETLDSVLKCVAAQAANGDPRVLEKVCAVAGFGIFRMPTMTGRGAAEVMSQVSNELKAVAAQSQAIALAYSDNDVNPEELATIQARTRELVNAAMRTLAVVEAFAADRRDAEART